MIWIVIISAILFLIYKFSSSIQKDVADLTEKPVHEKFFVVVNVINEFAFNGKGKVFELNYSQFNLYEEGSNQIIQFSYSLGGLVIDWKYKYAQKEVTHQEYFENVRNISLPEQEIMANKVITNAREVINKHRNQIDAFTAQVDKERILAKSEDRYEKQAREMFEYIHSQGKLTTQQLLENAIEKIKAEDYEGALNDARRGLARAEVDSVPMFHHVEALCYMEGGDYEKALAAISKGIAVATIFPPDDSEYLNELEKTKLEILNLLNDNIEN